MKKILLPLFITIFILTSAVILTLNFRPLYYHDMTALKIEQTSGFSKKVIYENYNALINYNSIFQRGDLSLTLPMSEEGKIHFMEVKRIFDVIQLLCPLSFAAALFLGLSELKKKQYRFFKTSAITTILLPAVCGIFAAFDWERTFTVFHQIMFRNDYWLFDEKLDPVITILPDEFFFHCVFMILLIVFLETLLCLGFHAFFRRRFML